MSAVNCSNSSASSAEPGTGVPSAATAGGASRGSPRPGIHRHKVVLVEPLVHQISNNNIIRHEVSSSYFRPRSGLAVLQPPQGCAPDKADQRRIAPVQLPSPGLGEKHLSNLPSNSASSIQRSGL